MKKLNTIIALFFVVGMNIFSQSGFSYQGLLRNANGKLRTMETLNLTASLIKDGSAIYTETHQVTTNAYGVFSMVIGNGASLQEYSPAVFLSSDSTMVNAIYLKVTEGTTVISNTQILGVPFAEVAKVALKAHIDFPAGSIIAFGGDTSKIPAGWLFCDGKGYSKTLYPALFAAIGTHWGIDGEQFKVPDLRGVFLRGVNYNANDKFADPDRNDRVQRGTNVKTGNEVGSFQADTLAAHSHEIKRMAVKSDGGGSSVNWSTHTTYPSNWTENTGGNETRPVNAYVNYIIKY